MVSKATRLAKLYPVLRNLTVVYSWLLCVMVLAYWYFEVSSPTVIFGMSTVLLLYAITSVVHLHTATFVSELHERYVYGNDENKPSGYSEILKIEKCRTAKDSYEFSKVVTVFVTLISSVSLFATGFISDNPTIVDFVMALSMTTVCLVDLYIELGKQPTKK